MSRERAFITTVVASLVMIGAGVVNNSLTRHYDATVVHDATITQCANHDWPVDAHDIHIAWCHDNGYATK